MLKQLTIQNIILIETAVIPFESCLNVLSGETGAGKSAIMNALSLLTGERADAGMIRRGSEKGSVEAIFDIDSHPHVKRLLEESGIDHEEGNELIVRREVSAAGRSRAFINNQMVQLGVLRSISVWLLDLIGQHANHQLLSIENHRSILDLYGDLEKDVSVFSNNWTKENEKRRLLDELISSEAQRLRDIDRYQRELEELEEAKLKENEEDELFSEYTLLTNAQELSGKVHDIYETLSGERQAVLPVLNRLRGLFDQLVRIDPSLSEIAKEYESVLIELQEIAHTLGKYQSNIERNPSREIEVNDRLSLIDRLKRRYGASVKDIQAYQMDVREKLKQLMQTDIRIEELHQELNQLEKQNNILGQQITQKREIAALCLEKGVVEELRALNMPKVEFYCRVSSQRRSQTGDNQVEFFLRPNVGEHDVAVRDCASGGELSRLMLAIQVLLAGKKKTPTLIFDEIDANIGGETASVVGLKLKEIGQKHQVLCITHFPQVAKQGDHHLQISKNEQNGRTITMITILSGANRKKEIMRMLGGKPAVAATGSST